MTENEYQRRLIDKIKRIFPECWIVKNDAGYRQGIPDLTIFSGRNWAFLEVKASAKAKERPNQRYHVERLNDMGFAAFIYPENEAEVLSALQQALASPGDARIS